RPRAQPPPPTPGSHLGRPPQTPSAVPPAAGSSQSQRATAGRRPRECPQVSARRSSTPRQPTPPDRGCRAAAHKQRPPEDKQTPPGTEPPPRKPNRPPYPLLPRKTKTVTHDASPPYDSKRAPATP